MRAGFFRMCMAGLVVFFLQDCCVAGSMNSRNGEIHEYIHRTATSMSELVRFLPRCMTQKSFQSLSGNSDTFEQFNCMRLELLGSLKRLGFSGDLYEKQKWVVTSMRYLYFSHRLFEECCDSLNPRQQDVLHSLFHHMMLYLRAVSYTIHRYQMNELTGTW